MEKIAECDKEIVIKWVCDTVGGAKPSRFIVQRVSLEMNKVKKAKQSMRNKHRQRTAASEK